MKKILSVCCVAALLAASLFANATPAYRDNFYKAVNQKWLDSHKIKEDEGEVSNFSLISDHILEQSKQLIEEIRAQKKRTQDEQNLLNLYDSYLDMDHRSALGIKPIEGILKKIDQIKNSQDLAKVFVLFEKKSIATPIHISMTEDMKDSSRYIISIGESGISLLKKHYERKDENAKKQVSALKHLYRKLLTLAGYDNVDKRVENAMAVEHALAKVQWTQLQNRNPKNIYNITPYRKIKGTVDNLDLDAMLKALHIPETATFNVEQPSYLKALNGLLTSISIEKWKEYARLVCLAGKAGELTPEFEKTFMDRALELGLVAKVPSAEKRAIGLVQSMGMLFGKLYVKHFFDEKSKEKIKQIVQTIQASYKEAIKHSKRLSPSTKEAALQKIYHMLFNVAYPKKWIDYSKLDFKADDLAGNKEKYEKFELLRIIKKLDKKVDREEWGVPPQVINAFYDPSSNKFVLLAAILQKPFFDVNGSKSVNYGGIGFIVGHEMGHCFDDRGSQFDYKGNMKNWWTPGDHAAFDVLKEKLIKQANAYEVLPGKFANGKLEISEIIADLSGAEIALISYMKTDEAQKLPRKEALQAFFRQIAKTWRSKALPQITQMYLDSDPHPANEYRSNGTIRNMDEFYEAFDIQKGDKMWLDPEKRVKVW